MLISHVRRIPLFKGFSATALKAVASCIEVQELDEHRLLFRQDQKRDKFFIVLQGAILIERTILGHEEPLAAFKPYDIIGEGALYAPSGKHQHSARALEPHTMVASISVYHLFQLFRKHPETALLLNRSLLAIVNERLGRTNEKLLTLFATSTLTHRFNRASALAHSVTDTLHKLFRVRKALLLSIDAHTNTVIPLSQAGYRRKLPARLSLKADPLLLQLSSNLKPIIITPPLWQKHYENSFYASDNMLIVPLVHQKELLGAIVLTDKTNRHHFGFNNEILLSAIARQLAPALEELSRQEWQKNERLLKAEFIDPFKA